MTKWGSWRATNATPQHTPWHHAFSGQEAYGLDLAVSISDFTGKKQSKDPHCRLNKEDGLLALLEKSNAYSPAVFKVVFTCCL